MEYTSVSAKLPRNELTLLKNYCKRKKVTPSKLIRELIQKEIEFPFPSYVAGENIIEYDKENDSFIWIVELDNGNNSNVLEKIDFEFLLDLNKKITKAIDKRDQTINRKKQDSIAISAKFMK